MTLEEAIKNFEQEIDEFERFKKIHAVTHEDYEHIGMMKLMMQMTKMKYLLGIFERK